MNYRVRLLIATVGTLLLTIIITGCDEKANILDNSKIELMENDSSISTKRRQLVK
jgi:hypothetical protein